MSNNGISFLIFLIIVIVIKQIIGYFNSKIYTQEYKEMINNRKNGYFGVGVYQPKFKIGQVCLIVIDDQNIIQDCRVIKGLSVFARFHPDDTIIKENIDSKALKSSKYYKSITLAIENALNAQKRRS
ncbi:transcriptional regulator GutM [Xylocopilactobacillus apicola]|uniref:Glucitol operon activator protein n=1 Tax=Xylocopilactobacillus apicola TaxID=2932184 RepID=A0AAU9D1H4_9LACO|nr:transcriptional regulator GutM [Xylocopilactobacillus apicola]BDR57564.1 hypothetical protein XA3_00050 [Xylocopilactobacillus apicola]